MEAQRMHPDLALLMQPERRDIVCLALEGARDAQIAALCALEPFHVYRQGALCALLFDGAEDRLPRIRQALGAQGFARG